MKLRKRDEEGGEEGSRFFVSIPSSELLLTVRDWENSVRVSVFR